jgi:pyridoxamine 5'-phosphate oxidase
MVLLKGFDEQGLVFFTNYESRKGLDLAENPRGAALLYWWELGRQVRVSGSVSRTPEAESAAYFHTRPLASQLSARASRQSQVIPSREVLEARVKALAAEYDGRAVPLPSFWGGYRLGPDTFEFWMHRENRLHDRFRYRLTGSRWVIERLSP